MFCIVVKRASSDGMWFHSGCYCCCFNYGLWLVIGSAFLRVYDCFKSIVVVFTAAFYDRL